MSDKLLTIVIPSYNMQDYLPKCLDSLIISQEWLDKLDILVINDGSKDKTSEIAHQYENKYPNVFRVIDKENGNYGSCINRGLAEAKGEYIKILDADDSFNTENFEKFVQYIQESCSNEEDVDLFLTDYLQLNNDGIIIASSSFHLKQNITFNIKNFPIKEINSIFMHNVTYRTENLRKMNYYQTEGISYTDTQWIFHPLISIRQIKYFPYIIYIYLLGRPDQTCAPEIFNKNFWMSIKCLQDTIKWYTNIDLSQNLDAANFIRYKLNSKIQGIYSRGLLDSKEISNPELLSEFDEYFKKINPALYQESNKIVNNGKYHFKFIAYWRRNHNTKSLNYTLYRLYRKLIILRNKILHK